MELRRDKEPNRQSAEALQTCFLGKHYLSGCFSQLLVCISYNVAAIANVPYIINAGAMLSKCSDTHN